MKNTINEKSLEDNLRIQMERFNLIKDLCKEIIFEYVVDKHVFLIPDELRNFRSSEGFRNGEITEKDFIDLIHPKDRHIFLGHFETVNKKPYTGKIEYRINTSREGKRAKYSWFRTVYRKVEGENGKVIRVVGRIINIEDERKKTNHMELKVRQDPMTGMLNKMVTERELERFFKKLPEGNHALIMIDIDDFKRVNDYFGHLYGDTILKDISQKIMGRFRSTDVIGRVGGDEFLVCMKDATVEMAVSVAEEICAMTKHSIRADDEEVKVSCSVGIGMYPDNGKSFKELFKAAEIAMYTAKQDGKAGVKVFERFGLGRPIEKEGKRETKYRMSVQSDTEFLTMCFEMLIDAKDLDAAINVLLEHIGKRFGLGGVAVFRFNQYRVSVRRTNKWTSEQGILTMPGRGFLDFDNQIFIESFDKNNRIVIDDMKTTNKVTRYEAELMLSDDIQACVYAGFYQSDYVQGCVAYQSIGRTRTWTEEEKNFFSEFARMIAVFCALSDKQNTEKNDLAELKQRDQLTGMLTEEAFIDKVSEYRKSHKEEKKLIIANADIDGFSYVNENFGIAAGNELLKELALVFRREDENIICCRQFSDFFAGFFAGYTMGQVQALIRRAEVEFISRAREYYPSSGIRMAIGLYEWDEDVSVIYAIENANIARKAAKKGVGNSKMVVYNSEMREARMKERAVASQFKEALERGEFETYIQPKFDLKSREIVGAECLSRWISPHGHVIAPLHYVSALERIGYIMDLDFYVLEQVLQTMRMWKDAGYQLLPMSVNFSRKHFENKGIYKKVKRLVDQYEIPHNLIEIELTESLLSERMENVILQMELLRKDGFLVDIDDFGTGYSSLSMLLEVPTDVVKIDKSFLNFENSKVMEERRAFMRLLAKMLYAQNNEVICEGVETEAQAQFLIECGFKTGQGYLCDKPISLEEFGKKYIIKS